MSRYIYNLGACIEKALSGVPRAQPEQVAGYWANRDFWLGELQHLVEVIEGYETRFKKMLDASERLVGPGGGHNRDEFGQPRQQVVDTTSVQQRQQDVRGASNAVQALAERAFDLRIARRDEFDHFLERIRQIKHRVA